MAGLEPIRFGQLGKRGTKVYLSDLRYVHPVLGAALVVTLVGGASFLGWQLYSSRASAEGQVEASAEVQAGWREAEGLAKTWGGLPLTVTELMPEGGIKTSVLQDVSSPYVYAQMLSQSAAAVPGYLFQDPVTCEAVDGVDTCKLYFTVSGQTSAWSFSSEIITNEEGRPQAQTVVVPLEVEEETPSAEPSPS